MSQLIVFIQHRDLLVNFKRDYRHHAPLNLCRNALVVARELAPAGVRSTPKPITELQQMYLELTFGGCFAAQREQAPSPHKLGPAQNMSSPNASHSTATPGTAQSPPRCSSRLRQ